MDKNNENGSISIEKHRLFDILNLNISNLVCESESQDYAAANLIINGRKIKFRTGKITPTKIGQFVTFWKRNEKNITIPYDQFDDFDFLIIQVQLNKLLGFFIFPKIILVEKGIVSSSTKEGKRGFRLYPSWDLAENSQAIATQKWQLLYFFEATISNPEISNRVKVLFETF